MPLAELVIDDLRCIEKAELALAPGLNVLWGPNGSGKTSILEAIFLLGRGRSFRTRNTERLIRFGRPAVVAFGRTSNATTHAVGVQVSKLNGTEAKVDGSFVTSLAELSGVLPVQIINPEIHRLVEEGPNRRRRWLDWAVFHVEPGFIGHWTRYQRALSQRNAALKHPGADLVVWNREVAHEGEPLTEARQRVLGRLQGPWVRLQQELAGLGVSLGYYRGWPEDLSLEAALRAGLPRDRERGTTTVGPHRADLTLRIEGRAARDVLSRGQQKLTAIALTLAQLELLQAETGLHPTLLLDDPQAELDAGRLESFLERVKALRCQLIVTSLASDFELLGHPDQRFHVEQGRVEVA
jgi:DNA replication and repair protein RecF